MDFVLLALALAILSFAGAGMTLLLHPRASLIELLGLSFLFGTALVSMLSFLGGFVLSSAGLRWAVTLTCLAIGVCGWWHRASTSHRNNLAMDWRWFALGAVQTSFVSWLARQRVLGWDGLLIFEIKARLAFLNGGVIPAEYYADPFRAWTHPSYPLLLPLTESWLYLWLGRADQQLVKILFPMFFASGLAMLFVANCRAGRRAPIPLLLLMTVPLVWIGNGSASSGYADFPLAVFYLAAIVYLLEFQRTGDWSAPRLVGALLACACWLKREGAILWLCVMLMALAMALRKRGWRELGRNWRAVASALAPGLAVVFVWRGFTRSMHLTGHDDFLAVGYAAMRANLQHLPVIARAVASEMVHVRHWGIFWWMTAAAAVWMVVKRR